MTRVCSAAAIAATVLAAHAQAQPNITSGFDTSSNWSFLGLNTSGSFGFVASSNGNPGGYADLQPLLDGSGTLAGAGLYQTFPLFTVDPSWTDVILSADYKYFSGPTTTLVPFLWQNSLLYRPSASFTLDANAAWHPLGTMDFPISTFTTGSGIPLNTHFFTQIGFMAVLRSQTPTIATAHVGIDNLTLQVIPAPAAAPLLLAAGALARRRR